MGTKIYTTYGAQTIIQQRESGADEITVRYKVESYEKDPQPGVDSLDTYTTIWAKNWDSFVEICEAHAGGKNVIYEEVEQYV